MKLTPLEIKQQTFDKSLRGYDPAEVQAFLNLVANEWEHLANKNSELTTQIDKLNEKLKHYERVESALHETLQTARESAEQKLGGAKKESRNILDKAELEAERIVREAYKERQEIRQSLVRLMDKRNEMITGIRSYLENAQESLQQFHRDEANLFSVPPASEEGNSVPEPNRSRNKSKSNPAAEQTSVGRSGKTEAADSDTVDDILDEID